MGIDRVFTLDYLYTQLLQPGEEVKEPCSVCMDTPMPEDTRLTPCNHTFCKSCIDEWLTTGGASCPLCRYELYVGLPMGEPVLVPRWEQELNQNLHEIIRDFQNVQQLYYAMRYELPDCTLADSEREFLAAAQALYKPPKIDDTEVTLTKASAGPSVMAMGLMLLKAVEDALTDYRKREWQFICQVASLVVLQDLDEPTGPRRKLRDTIREQILACLVQPGYLACGQDNPLHDEDVSLWFCFIFGTDLDNGDLRLGLTDDLTHLGPSEYSRNVCGWMFENLLQHIVIQAREPQSSTPN